MADIEGHDKHGDKGKSHLTILGIHSLKGEGFSQSATS